MFQWINKTSKFCNGWELLKFFINLQNNINYVKKILLLLLILLIILIILLTILLINIFRN